MGDNGFVKVIDTSTNTVSGSIETGSTPFGLVVGGDALYVVRVITSVHDAANSPPDVTPPSPLGALDHSYSDGGPLAW